MSFQQFASYLHKSVIPQSICLVTHLICAIALIFYIYANRDRTPIIQNSPILTIVAQIFLVLASICLFGSKCLIIDEIRRPNPKSVQEKYCFGINQHNIMIGLNVVYTFCIQFMYMTYLLKMTRVLLICTQNKIAHKLYSVFKSQWKLVFIATCYGALVMGSDLLMKRYIADYDGKHSLHIYPQFNQFMCDSNVNAQDEGESRLTTIVFIGKLVFSFLLYFITFGMSFWLQQIDRSLKMRLQYFIILILPYSIWITDKIIKIVEPLINTSLPVHYADCFSNLLTGLLIFRIHFNQAKGRYFFLTEAYQMEGVDFQPTPLMYNNQIRQTWQSYFATKNKQRVFDIMWKIIKKGGYDHQQPTQANIAEICACLQQVQKFEVNSNFVLLKKFDKAKQIVERKFKKQIQQWKQTVSGVALHKKLVKNGEYMRKMRQLNLIKSPLDQVQDQEPQSQIY